MALFSRQTVLRSLALAAGAGASVAVASKVVEEYETRSEAAIETALDRAGYSWVGIETDGLLAALSGEAPDEVTRFRVLSAAGKAVNPAHLRDQMRVADTAELPPPDYRIEILRTGADMTVHGLIPGGAQGRVALTSRLSALTRGSFSDLVTGAPEPASEAWQQLIDVAVDAAATLENSRVLVTESSISVAGLAADRETADALETRMGAALPESVELKVALKLPRPMISPFTVQFRIDDEGADLESCAAESADGRARIEVAARAAGAPDSVSCTEALGAPDPSWSRAVADGIGVLAKLGAGSISYSDLTVRMRAGPGVTLDALAEAETELEGLLPALYTLSVSEPPVSRAEEGAAPPPSVEFFALRSPEGLVMLRGPIATDQGRAAVESFAAARFADSELSLALRQNSALETGWQVRVIAGIDALARLKSGSVTVTPHRVQVRGVSDAEIIEAEIASGLTAALGPDADVTLAIEYIAPPPEPEDTGPDPEICVARVNGVLETSKIVFAPGSVELDEQGFATVDDIAEILRECTGVRMEIGGHTDSQGRESMNLELSQSRAEAVLDALMARRVLAADLTAQGYGEAEPIADNGTAAGREANRRIAFRLLDPLPAEGDAEDAEDGTGDFEAEVAGSETQEEPADGPE